MAQRGLIAASCASTRKRLRIVAFHQTFRMRERREAETCVEIVRVAGRQHEAADPLQIRMRKYELDQVLAESMSALIAEHEHIGQPRESSAVGDHARERDLPVLFVGGEASRSRDRLLDEFAADTGHAVRLAAQKVVNQIDIQATRISGK